MNRYLDDRKQSYLRERRKGNIEKRRTDLYAIPVLGDYLYRLDRIQDLQKMDADYRRNTGRTYAYRTESYGARASHDAGRVVADAMRMVGRQYRRNV